MNTIENAATFRSMFDALPFPVFVVDGDAVVHNYNAAALKFMLQHAATLGGLSYSVQTDLDTTLASKIYWRAFFSRNAFIGKAVNEAVQGHCVERRFTGLDAHREGFQTVLEIHIKCLPFHNGEHTQVLLVFEDTAVQNNQISRIAF